MQNNSTLRSRLLALGILVIVLLLMAMLVVNPYISLLKSSEDYVNDQSFQLKRNKILLSKREFYIDELDRLENSYSADDVYLSSTKNALASAEMQQLVKQLASSSDAELISTQSIDEDEELNAVGVSIRIKADIFSLQKFIYSLEGGSPNLFIKELLINRSGRTIFRHSNTESSSQSLDVSMRIVGYINNKKPL